jgi:hypothetical protein
MPVTVASLNGTFVFKLAFAIQSAPQIGAAAMYLNDD